MAENETPAVTEPPPGPTDQGTCGFCGVGDGHLLDQGNETATLLSSTVRSGEAPDWTYSTHPHAHDSGGDSLRGQYITWCGRCLRGLAHKYQRLDDLNLAAKLHAWSLWKELDGIRWHAGWEAESDALDLSPDNSKRFDPNRPEDAGRLASRRFQDDKGTHLDKLHREREIRDMTDEQRRRWAFGWTQDRLYSEGWRP